MTKQDIQNKLTDIIIKYGIHNLANEPVITEQSRFLEDLNFDSLDSVEFIMLIEKEFNIPIPDEHAEKWKILDDAVSYVSYKVHQLKEQKPLENTKQRNQIPSQFITSASKEILQKLNNVLQVKGHGTLSSIHEILGIITEEHYELVEAVKINSQQHVRKELIDIAVGCLFGIACIDAETLDW